MSVDWLKRIVYTIESFQTIFRKFSLCFCYNLFFLKIELALKEIYLFKMSVELSNKNLFLTCHLALSFCHTALNNCMNRSLFFWLYQDSTLCLVTASLSPGVSPAMVATSSRMLVRMSALGVGHSA